jgi:hypothetical protein
MANGPRLRSNLPASPSACVRNELCGRCPLGRHLPYSLFHALPACETALRSAGGATAATRATRAKAAQEAKAEPPRRARSLTRQFSESVSRGAGGRRRGDGGAGVHETRQRGCSCRHHRLLHAPPAQQRRQRQPARAQPAPSPRGRSHQLAHRHRHRRQLQGAVPNPLTMRAWGGPCGWLGRGACPPQCCGS